MWRAMAVACAVVLNPFMAATADQGGPPRGLRPYLVAISVANLDESIAWYEKALGLRTADKKSFPEQGLKVAFLESEGFRLELVELKGSVSPASCTDVTNPAALRGFGKYAFRVDDLAELAGRFRAMGISILHDFRSAPEARARSIIIKDNEGNWLQFFQGKI